MRALAGCCSAARHMHVTVYGARPLCLSLCFVGMGAQMVRPCLCLLWSLEWTQQMQLLQD
jgi:hypothetical protein